MAILVLGGAGYIGSHTVHELIDAGHDVVVIDNLLTGFVQAVHPTARFYKTDIRDRAALDTIFEKEKIEGVIHFAASSQVGESMADPLKYYDNNVGGTIVLLQAMGAHGLDKIVFSSTAATYGEPDAVPITEDAPTRPTNTYAATKLAVDMMITGECAATELAAVSLRYFNVAGAALGAGERHAVETHLIPNALGAVTGTKDPLTVFGDDWPTPDGTPIRDYVHVLDLARAHVQALTAATPGEHLICNLGNGDGYSVNQVLSTIEEVTDKPVPHTIGPRRAGDPTRLVASADRARDRLGWTARLSLREMIADAWEFQQSGRTIR